MFRFSLTLLASGLMRKAGKVAKVAASVDSTAATPLGGAYGGDPSKIANKGTGKGGKSRRGGSKKKSAEDGEQTGGALLAQPTGFVPVDNASMGIVGYKGRHSEKRVLELAERMQRRDITGEVPVASFAYEILKSHPSVRQMGLRERMSFLCDRWDRLSEKQRKAYLDDPLKGLL